MSSKIVGLNQLFKQNLSKYRDKTALVYEKKKLTYAELKRAANKVAHAFIQSKVEPNTRVALLIENSVEYVICDIGIIFAGATKVPLNYMLGENEIEYILNDSSAEVLIVGEEFFEKVQHIASKLQHTRLIVGISKLREYPKGFMPWEEFQQGQPEDDVSVPVKSDDMAGIMYTGGTTGRPKGVVHDQTNVLHYLNTHITELEIKHDEKILLNSPLPHSAGVVLQAGLLKGAEHWIERRFDPNVVLDRISNDKITFTFMVPTMIYRLLDHAQERKGDYRSLRTIMYGAAPMNPERLAQGLSIFGSVFLQIYGQTEAPNLITKLRKEDHVLGSSKLNSCGQPVTMSLVKIVDNEGKEVPIGEEGEIVANTPYNMVEYFCRPKATDETVVDGWIHTGDVGRLDEEGYLYLLDRKKDMIISGGLNIYSVEVENVILEHPDVQMVAVVGVPHAEWGEMVMAVVVPKVESLTEVDIVKHCELLTKYKRPRIVKIVDTLPLTPYGKIDKKALKKESWKNVERGIN